MPTAPTKAAELFDKIAGKLPFPELWEQVGEMEPHRIECDDGDGMLCVVAGPDGDLHAAVMEGPRREQLHHFGPPGFRARTHTGGGRHERVRRALMLLALAIEADRQA